VCFWKEPRDRSERCTTPTTTRDLRDTTAAGCLPRRNFSQSCPKAIMVCRSYPIRVQIHRAQNPLGPCPRNLTWKEIAKRSGIPEAELRRTERTSTTIGNAESASRLEPFPPCGLAQRPDRYRAYLADYISIKNREASRFETTNGGNHPIRREIERVASAPVP